MLRDIQKHDYFAMYEMYEEYELEDIWDSVVFAKDLEVDQLLAWDLPLWYDNKSTWEPTLVV